jgi:hypothetical protein
VRQDHRVLRVHKVRSDLPDLLDLLVLTVLPERRVFKVKSDPKDPLVQTQQCPDRRVQ